MKTALTKLKGGIATMANREIKGAKPDLKGELDVAAWYNTEDGRTVLSVQLGKRIKLYPNEDKQQEQHQNPKALVDPFD